MVRIDLSAGAPGYIDSGFAVAQLPVVARIWRLADTQCAASAF